MDVLHTPDERFEGLPGFAFRPNYVEVEGLRMHFVDEGPYGARPVLMLHGEPTWSYLYRKLIPPVAAAGHRVVAPDLVGFGRSDKPARREDHTYAAHVGWLLAFLRELDLYGVTLLCHDWGGLVGLRLAAEHPDRFARIVAVNTFLPTPDFPVSESFLRWRQYSQETQELRVGRIVNGGCVEDLAPEVVAAYDAPFPDESYRAGPRQVPLLVPTEEDDPATEPNRRAWGSLMAWRKPFLTAFGDSDPITRGGDLFFQQAVPGAQDQPHTTIEGAGHFVQEDRGPELATVLLDFLDRTA